MLPLPQVAAALLAAVSARRPAAAGRAMSRQPRPTSTTSATLVRSRSAIVLDPGKEYLVEARLLPLARERGLATVGDLVARLRAGPAGPLAARSSRR